MYEFAPYVDGEWHETDERLSVTDLATSDVCAVVETTDEHLARDALAAADAAGDQMRATSAVRRAEWLEAIASEIDARSETLADAVVREAGKPVTSARSEVSSAAERFQRAAAEARDLSADFGGYREGSTAGHEGWEAVVKPEPVGTVLCIAPYNYPLATTALQVAPALAAGNSVVVKPASETPVSAALLTEIVDDALDLPDGAFNYVPGRSREIGDVLASDDRVRTIAMTGSSNAGERIARESGMVNLHMELGGNAPALVFPDADLDDVADDCAAGSFKYGGQRCSAVSRVLAHEHVHDDLVSRIEPVMDEWQSGDLFDESTTFGPLNSAEHPEWVGELVDDALERGARLVRGGDRDGAFFEPTLLSEVPRDARLLSEEQFGPVCAIAPFEDEETAVDIANDTDLALDAAIYTADYERATSLAETIDAGTVRINGPPSHGIGDIPYGGNGQSGIGREGIGVTIESMLRTKTVVH